jgi:alpha-tubulin suppressor-like RCC1 family protein
MLTLLTGAVYFYCASGALYSWVATDPNSMVLVSNGVKIRALAAGGDYLLVLDSTGSVSSCGTSNKFGQLGRDGPVGEPRLCVALV